MGFGSYDEDDQEQRDESTEEAGEDLTGEFKQADHEGSESVDNTVEELIDTL